MGKRKIKKTPTGKDILATQVGQKFADVVIKALIKHAQKVMPDDEGGVPAIILNRGAGSFAIISDDTVRVLNTIQTPVAVIKLVAGTDELAWKLWNILQKHGIKEAGKMCPALLLRPQGGEFIAIDSEDEKELA